LGFAAVTGHFWLPSPPNFLALISGPL